MAFALKQDWPIIAAGGAAVVGFLMLRGGSSSATTYAPAAATTESDAANQGPNANQLALIEAAMSIDAQNKQYDDELSLAQISADSTNYQSYLSNIDSEFGGILNYNTAAVQSNAAVQAIKAQQPSGLSQFLNGLANLASSVAPFFTGMPSVKAPSSGAQTTPAPSSSQMEWV